MPQRSQAQHPNLAEHPLVTALVPDPSQGPLGATVLRGYLGRGTASGVWRLYLEAGLKEWVELEEAAILHSESLPDDQGNLIWVASDRVVQYVRSQAQQVPASQIGAVQARALPGDPRIQPLGAQAGVGVRAGPGAVPFTLATPHHAPDPLPSDIKRYKRKYSDDKKRRDDYPKSPYLDDPDDPCQLLTDRYDQLLSEYLDLAAAYEELRLPRR
jgi:hypothetical protein